MQKRLMSKQYKKILPMKDDEKVIDQFGWLPLSVIEPNRKSKAKWKNAYLNEELNISSESFPVPDLVSIPLDCASLRIDISDENNQSNSFGLLLRDYQVLWDERKRVSKAAQSRNDIFLLICTYDDNFEELMKLFEEPSHLKFNQKKINFFFQALNWEAYRVR